MLLGTLPGTVGPGPGLAEMVELANQSLGPVSYSREVGVGQMVLCYSWLHQKGSKAMERQTEA